MVKIRLMGLPEEVQSMVEDLKKHYQILQKSTLYKNRNSEYVRIYLDLQMKNK